MLFIFNKIDLYRERNFDELLEKEIKAEILTELRNKFETEYEYDTIFISALNKENISELKSLLKEKINALYEKRYPYQAKYW